MTEHDGGQLWRMEGKLDVLVSKFGDVQADVADHESRIRTLERWRYTQPTSLLIAVASLVAVVVGGMQ